MPLKGDASQIPLTNIFQTLQLNGQQGVLSVSSSKVRRKIRILPTGVRLLSSTRDSPDALRAALVKLKVLTEAQFQNALSTMGQPAGYPGDFLISRRILTPEVVERQVSKQFRELIYEIFSWKKARYEFTAGDPGNDLELFDPAVLGESLVFAVQGILMEVARREDEWGRIREEIPSDREIFTAIDRQAFLKPRSYRSEVDPDSIQQIKKLLNGENAIEAIIAESTLSSFETYRVLVLLLGQKEIRPLTSKEKKDLAEELRKKLKVREVIEIYRHLLDEDPQDVDTRLKLVSMLERKKEGSPLLVEQYELLAEHYYRAGEYVPALNYLEKVIAVDHLHVGALDRLFEIHHLSSNSREALETAHKLVEAIKAKKEFERGAEVLLKMVDLYPTETFLYQNLADFFIFTGQNDSAVMALKSVANLYEERGELVKLRKTYERIAAIDPGEAPNLKKVVDAERRRSRRRPFTASRWTVWIALGGVLLAGGIYLAVLEVMARRAYAQVQESVRSCTEAGDFRNARLILEDLARRYPLSTLSARLSALENDLSTKERERDEVRRKNEEREKVLFGSFLARLEPLMSGRRYMEALALAEETGHQALGQVNRKKVDGIQSEIRQYFAVSANLLREAQEMIAGGRHEEAHRQYLTILMNYANTPAAQGLKLPLLVKSVPPAAAVAFNGEAAGTTPLTLYYNPFAKFTLSLSKEGFRPAQLGEGGHAIDFTRDWMVSVRLERIPAWIFDAKAPVECCPLLQNGRAFFGTRGGRIFCVDAAQGTEVWSYDIPDGWDVASGLRGWRDRLLFGTFDGAFHILDAAGGRPLGRLTPFSPPRPIRQPASEATESGVMAINCGGAAVAALNVSSLGIAWTYRTEGEVLGSPELAGNLFVASTVDGTVHGIDVQTGAAACRLSLGARLDAPGKCVGGSYIVGDAAGRIRRINLKTGAVEWTYDSPMESLTAPTLGGEVVFFASESGLMAALDVRTGDLRWKGRVTGGISTPAVFRNGNFFLGTRSGQAVSLEAASGGANWSFGAGAPFMAPPGAAGGMVLFGSDDHRVYAFGEKEK